MAQNFTKWQCDFHRVIRQGTAPLENNGLKQETLRHTSNANKGFSSRQISHML